MTRSFFSSVLIWGVTTVFAAAEGIKDGDCLDCHADKTLTKTDAAGREVSLFVDTAKLAASSHKTNSCASCHKDITARHPEDEVPRRPIDCGCCHERQAGTYGASVHGVALKAGRSDTATCQDCHDSHEVLPGTSSASTIHPRKLVETCGKCHPGASEEFALSQVHVDIEAEPRAAELGSQINRWVRRFYLLLIFGVVGAMFLHNSILFFRKVAVHLRSASRPILRMDLTQRWQHAVFALNFLVLAVTGFALKWPDSWVARLLGSDEQFRRHAHRVAGVVLLLVGIHHILYVLASKTGRRLVCDLSPAKADVTDVLAAVRYLFGLSGERPKFSRFGYPEKMEYWAVVWGTLIMGVTGLLIWFRLDVTQFLPRWVVDVALTIHYYEAVLACLVIVVWHFYYVMLDPDVYPLNPACWDGRVTERWQRQEHPLDTPTRADAAADATERATTAETANTDAGAGSR